MKKRVLRERRKLEDAQIEENTSKEKIRNTDATKTSKKRGRKAKND